LFELLWFTLRQICVGEALTNLGLYLQKSTTKLILEVPQIIKTMSTKTANEWILEGNLFSVVKKFEEAIECYNEALKINPKNDDVWCNKGNCYLSLKCYEEADKCYNEALKINTQNENVWHNKQIVRQLQALQMLERYK
jgi:tetratricopeptide (TPR) repeat protein